MKDNIVDIATERTQRRLLAERAAESGEAFIDGLESAGRTFADLAWLLAAPVRSNDRELTNGIYQLVLQRLGRIVDEAVAEGETASWTAITAVSRAKDVAFAAFTAKMIALVGAAKERRPGSSEDGTRGGH